MTQANPSCSTSKACNQQIAPGYQLAWRRTNKLSAWFSTHKGQQILTLQKKLVVPILARCFGQYAFQVSPVADSWLRAFSAVPCQWIMHFAGKIPSVSQALVHAATEVLPLANNSVNAILLHHTLDIHAAPHSLLRELERVLIPGGHLIVIGWHPWGLWGGYSALLRSSFFDMPVHWQSWLDQFIPWDNRFLSPHRLRDWLQLLGFEVEVEQVVSANPWLVALQSPLLQRYVGTFYILSAVKRSDCLTPIRPGWSLSSGQFASITA